MKKSIYLIILLFVICSLNSEPYTHELKTELNYRIREIEGKTETEIETINRYRILNEEGTKDRIFSIYSGSCTDIEDLKGRVNDFRSFRIDTFWKWNESPNVFSSDSKVHFIEFPSKLEIGDEVSFSYSTHYDDPGKLPLVHLLGNDKLKRYIVNFDLPENFDIEYELVSHLDSLEIVKSRNKDGIRFSVNNFPELEYKNYYDNNFEYGQILFKIVKNVEKGDSLQKKYITINSKEDYINHFEENYSLKPSIIPDSLISLNFEKNEDNVSKMKKIYKFVQKNIRYIAVMKDGHSYYPHKPVHVLKNGFGDCKDMSFLIYSIAAKYGINAYPAIISTESLPDFSIPHRQSYNHLINAFKNGDDYVFLDATTPYMNFNSVPNYLIGKRAFIMKREDPTFVKVKQKNDLLIADISIKVKMDSLKSCKTEIVLYNSYCSRTRMIREKSMKLDVENYLSNTLNGHFRKLSLDYFNLESEDEEKLIYTAKADLSEFILESSRSIYVPKSPFIFVGNDIFERDDKFPIHFYYTYSANLSIKLEDDLTIKQDKFEIGEDEKLGLKSSAKNSKDGILFTYNFNQYKKKYKSEEQKNELFTLINRFFKSKKQMYIIKKEN